MGSALVDDELVRYAVIDVGTNSVKFHIGERDGDGTWHTVVDRAEITRLGEGLDERGEIGPEALERTVKAIQAMLDEAERDGARAVAAVGTAGLRTARNGDHVLASIRERTGIGIEVISGGGGAARLPRGAGRPRSRRGSLVVFDTGGGSTQFTFGQGLRVDERFSVDVGAVRFTERFGLDKAVTAEVLSEALSAIADDLSRLDGRPPPAALVGMGGAVTNLAAVHHRLTTYDPDVVQGTVLDRAEIARRSSSIARGTPRSSSDRGPPAQALGRDPRRRVHRGDGHGQARRASRDGERSRAPPRPARRAVRALTIRVPVPSLCLSRADTGSLSVRVAAA